MHTVRNRLASRPPAAMPIAAGSRAPNHAAMRHELASSPRGSVAAAPVFPDEADLIEARPQKRRNAKGKKARKASARMAVTRAAKALPPDPAQVIETLRSPKPSSKKRKAKAVNRAAGHPNPSETVQPAQLPAIPAARPVMGSYSPPALTLPVRPEPLVEPLVAAASAVSPRVLSFADMPELQAREPEPEVRPSALLAVAEPLALLAEAPLPRARALVPARRQGLVDVIAFLLRDSGRRLARWSARRHKSRAERDALRRAEARQINLRRELEALDALQRSAAKNLGLAVTPPSA
ncbi:hypothetical protein [Novosphingobium sp. PASSN1]|uniref:hypothetical protein n=1 Tax=Novosphingobium sp. PASSN1 TaxID=2015561 RepID=UPI000BCAAC8A|nr:hypothetical protein [Novosphingobium sp. PASSN1]OYU35203.1 MAG: hypothetical protein CFE35_12355 [Novosphingobium sp. PASSN1]